jgi:hypothetical protein
MANLNLGSISRLTQGHTSGAWVVHHQALSLPRGTRGRARRIRQILLCELSFMVLTRSTDNPKCTKRSSRIRSLSYRTPPKTKKGKNHAMIAARLGSGMNSAIRREVMQNRCRPTATWRAGYP